MQQKGYVMKCNILYPVVMLVCCNAAVASDMPAGGYYERETQNCDMAAMQRELNDATAARRAVITVVKCAPASVAQNNRYDEYAYGLSDGYADEYAAAAAPVERVVSRRYYVEETVQQYRPVVRYEPAGCYTRMRRVCSECDT